MLMDAGIPGHRNVIKKEVEMILKYKNLIIEIQRMWNVKAKVILVVHNRGDWNHFKITQTRPEHHARRAQN